MNAWMESFCFICSVRLGVIVVCLKTTIQALLPLIYLLVCGTSSLQQYLFDPIEASAELKEQFALNLILTTFDNDAEKFGLFLIISFSVCISASILAIIGALRLYKWLLIPFIVVEFSRFIVLLSTHIVLMVLLKKKLNLGMLIAATVAGGFTLLLIGYMWTSVVAFFQILQVVETDKYKSLYGDDPLHPSWDSATYTSQPIENVRMYKSPNFDQITPLKTDKTVPKKQFPLNEKNIATIQINEPDIQMAVRQFQNWYGHELAVVRKSNLIRFS